MDGANVPKQQVAQTHLFIGNEYLPGEGESLHVVSPVTEELVAESRPHRSRRLRFPLRRHPVLHSALLTIVLFSDDDAE